MLIVLPVMPILLSIVQHSKMSSRTFFGWPYEEFSCSAVSVQLYSPRRPIVDVAEVFLWLMAVGTILFASWWSARTAREAAIEQDNLLKVITWIFVILTE